MPQTCLLVDAALPRTGSPTDRACAIVGYRRARNAAARRAQRRRRYCEGLFRHYEVSLHYQLQFRTSKLLTWCRSWFCDDFVNALRQHKHGPV